MSRPVYRKKGIPYFIRGGSAGLSFFLAVIMSIPCMAQDRVQSAFDDMDKEIEQSQIKQDQDGVDAVQSIQEILRKTFQEDMEKQEEDWSRLSDDMEKEWEEMRNRVNAQREELRQRVEQQWETFFDSSNKKWVDYSKEADTMSTVDFEKGEVEVSVLVPVETPVKEKKSDSRESASDTERNVRTESDKEVKKIVKQQDSKPAEKEVKKVVADRVKRSSEEKAKKLDDRKGNKASDKKIKKVADKNVKKASEKEVKKVAEAKIKQQIKKILSSDNDVHNPVLQNQIKDPEGLPVTHTNSDDYVEKYIVPELKIQKKPVIAKDGVSRVKATVRVKMVPEHLRIRAEQFRDQVDRYASTYDLDPALVYAVIHTESFFNPLARSHIPAFGLMQLVPKSGALDAYYYLNREKKLLPADYLYDPDNNIKLGSTYYHILNSIYLSSVKDEGNREALSIAAYNWGPGNIQKKIVSQNNLDTLSNNSVISLINSVAPKETRDYLRRVKQRMDLYRGM